MSPEIEQKLIEKFPSFFPQDRPIHESLIYFGMECSDGWKTILEKACEKIQLLNPKGFEFTQIKEKFGKIRVYWICDVQEDPEIYDKIGRIIDNLEKESGSVCEICGSVGTIKNNRGWLRTLCEEHNG